MNYCVCTDAVFMGKAHIRNAMKQVKECGYSAIELPAIMTNNLHNKYRFPRMSQTQASLPALGKCRESQIIAS